MTSLPHSKRYWRKMDCSNEGGVMGGCVRVSYLKILAEAGKQPSLLQLIGIRPRGLQLIWQL
ncbi:MAG: hypothetical protein V3V81_06225, partial [Candidatus Bathyarchaeia archaeon]